MRVGIVEGRGKEEGGKRGERLLYVLRVKVGCLDLCGDGVF